jgi:hypothetical protein
MKPECRLTGRHIHQTLARQHRSSSSTLVSRRLTVITEEEFCLRGPKHAQWFRRFTSPLNLRQLGFISDLGGIEYWDRAAFETGRQLRRHCYPPNALCKVHDLETFRADHRELVLEEVHTKGFCRDEEVFVESEPFCSLTKEIAERPPLS